MTTSQSSESAPSHHGHPVFIGGIAGTGKTRLGSCLGRHPNLCVTRRTYLWRDFYGRFGDLASEPNRRRCVAAVLASAGVRALGLDDEQIRSEFEDLPPTYAELFALVHRRHAAKQGKARWCDQLGLVEAYARPILDSYSDARMIHMVGDPRDPAMSARGPGRVGWMVGKWLTSVELADQNATHHPDRYVVVHHEELLADEEATLRKVCEFVGEEYDPAMASGEATSTDTTSAVGAGDRPDRRLRRPDSSRRFIERRAGAHLSRHGYRVDPTGPRARPDRTLAGWPANELALAVWRRVKAPSLARRAAVGS